MLSEITRVSCLASFALSGRGQVYPGSCVGSASPMQVSRGPKVAGWAPCTLAHARKQRRWAEPILGLLVQAWRAVSVQHLALEIGAESPLRGAFLFPGTVKRCLKIN